MLARNALVFVVATALTAAVAGAQQPKSTTPTKSATPTHQAPAAKESSKTTAQALPISSDSAKKIVMANEAGATVSSTKLHHESGKAYYKVSYHMKGQSKTMHATVDANTGAFMATPASTTKSSTKKPS